MTSISSEQASSAAAVPEPDDGTILEGVLAGAQTLIAAVPADTRQRPTPCHEYDVQALVEHMVSWLRMFDAGLAGQAGADPTTLGPGPDPAADFAEAAASVLRRWRDGGPQATVPVVGNAMPGPMVYRMMVGEYLIHGWDLAVATGQPPPFTTEQAEFALASLRGMLKPEYRGTAFGPEVPVPPDAGTIDTLVAFAGRDPNWVPTTAG